MILESIFYWTGGIFIISLIVLGIIATLAWLWNSWLKKSSLIFWRSVYMTLVTYYPNKDKYYNFPFEDKDGVTYKIIKIKDVVGKQEAL